MYAAAARARAFAVLCLSIYPLVFASTPADGQA